MGVSGMRVRSIPNTPVQNAVFWQAKLEANRRRDRLVGRTLRLGGWRLLRVWEHELSKKNAGRLLRRIRAVMEPKLGD